MLVKCLPASSGWRRARWTALANFHSVNIPAMLISSLGMDVEPGILETTAREQGSGQNSANRLCDFWVLVSFSETVGFHTLQHTLRLLSPRGEKECSLQYSSSANGLLPKHQSTTVYENNSPLQVARWGPRLPRSRSRARASAQLCITLQELETSSPTPSPFTVD